jgi:hypothetical protein
MPTRASSHSSSSDYYCKGRKETHKGKLYLLNGTIPKTTERKTSLPKFQEDGMNGSCRERNKTGRGKTPKRSSAHTGVTKRAKNPAQEHNTKDTKTHYRKGREKPPNCTKITTKRAMGVRQKTYKGKTQKQNSKGWRR